MKELFLINRGDALVPASEDAEEGLRAYPLGAQLRVRVTQKRSQAMHRFYFAFLHEAFVNWPDSHRFTPRDEMHLHGWLAVAGGFYEEHVTELAPDLKTAGLVATIASSIIRRMAGEKPFWHKVSGNKIITRWPKSIAFDKMEQDEFSRFATIMFTLIYSETGIDVDEYYRRWEEKNGGLNVKPTRDRSKAEGGLYFS